MGRRGFTLVEVLAAAAVMTVVTVSSVSMLLHAVRTCRNETAQVNTDNNAIIAMGHMVGKVKEAKNVTILDGPDADHGPRLSVVLPSIVDPGNGWPPYYDRTKPDTANPYTFYVSDSSGVVGRAGTYLWRAHNGENPWCIRRNVDYLWFETDTKKSIMITLRTKDRTYDPLAKSTDPVKTKYSVETDLTERVVYLRNY